MSHRMQMQEISILERLKQAWLILRDHILNTLQGSSIGALGSAAGAFVGGLLGGAAGMRAGGVAGGVLSFAFVRSFESLPNVAKNVNAVGRRQLGKITESLVIDLLWKLVTMLPLILKCKSWTELVQLIKSMAHEYGIELIEQVLRILLRHRSMLRFA